MIVLSSGTMANHKLGDVVLNRTSVDLLVEMASGARQS